MNENTYGDLKIFGAGTASGGKYDSVKISGSGRITGDIECGEFTINGTGTAEGLVTGGDLKINGAGHIKGKAAAKGVKVSGSADFDSDISCENLTVSGSTDIKGSIMAQSVKINGSVKAGGNVSAEKFDSDGHFEIGGLLSADDVDIHLYWHKSHAREIGGDRISAKLGSGGLGVIKAIFSLGTHNPYLETDIIEGNDIDLENTSAKIVRGNNITIGNGCDIGLVEYKGRYRKTGSAKVAEERKV